MAEPEPPAEAIGAVEPEPELPGASSLSPPHDGGEEPDLRHLRQSSSGSGGGARRNDASGYRPPLWSMSFGDPHGQWLTRDDASRDKLRASLHGEDAIQLEHVTNDQLVELEKTLRKRLYFEIDKTRSSNRASRIQTSDREKELQQAPEARERLTMILNGKRRAGRKKGDDDGRIGIHEFLKCMRDELRFGLPGRDLGLTQSAAAAWFMKVGHDDKGRMPIDVFVRRLFTGDAHVMSLEGSREGAFPRDKLRQYRDYTWKWQGMLSNAPHFAKTGVYAPSDWEEYATKVCKLQDQDPPEAYLKLEHVHGFSGLANTSNNLWYNAQGGLVYYAAAVGVVYDVVKPRGGEGEAEERQKFFLKHDNDITCIAAHPSRQVFATGQQQPPPPPRRQGDPIVKAAPKVYIWDAATRTGPGGRKKAVRLSLPPGDNELGCMAFSRRVHGMTDKDPGDLLLTVSRNSQHTVRVWHWQLDEEKCSGLADGMHGTPPQVYGCAWNPFRKDTGHRSDFVTYGVKHIMFWEYEEINPPIKNEDGDWIRCKLSPKAAQFGTPDSGQPTKHNVLAVCYLPTRHVLAGYEDGSIGVFDHPRADALGKSADDVSEKVLARKACGPEGPTGLIKQLHQKRNLKTVAVQEIRRAHRRGESTDPGSRDGQWGIKNGGCTALTLANTQDVVFSGGGDGRIIEWRIDIRGLSGAEVPLVPKPELGMRDDSGGSDILTPRRVFNASLIDPKGPSRMFVGLDCWDVQADGTRRICAGDTENDVWQIMQRKDGDSDPNYPTFDSCDPVNDFKFKLEGQSDAVFGVAPFPCHELNGAEHPCKDVFATACEDGNVTIWDAKKRKHVRKLEIRRHGCRGGELAGRPVPRGTAKGDLLRVKACAFSNVDGRMLAIATCGVRQTNETLVATLPEGVEPEVPIWVKIHRKSGGKPERVEVALQKPAEPESPSLNYFKYTAPRAARPGLQFAVDVPLEHVKAMGGFGETLPPVGLDQVDQGGTVQVYAYDDASKWVKVAADQYNAGEAPTLLYEEKLSTEAIDVLRFSPGDNMLAAGSHDNFVYVLGKTKGFADAWEKVNFQQDVAELTVGPFFERVGVCACHSSYITALDWSSKSSYTRTDGSKEWQREDAGDTGFLLQSTCGAYETIYHEPATDSESRTLGAHITLPDGEVWPVCKVVRKDQRDRKWSTWTCTLGFPVMGIWQHGMDGTDINACDRSPLIQGMSLKQLYDREGPHIVHAAGGHRKERGRCMVTANDDGTVGLFQWPSVLQHAPHHSFRGHASHVVNVRFSADGSRVISAGGADRTTFQWKTHGVMEPSHRFQTTNLSGRASQAAKSRLRKEQQGARKSAAGRLQKTARSPTVRTGKAPASKPKSTSRKLREKEEQIARLKDEELKAMLSIQALELAEKDEEISRLRESLRQSDPSASGGGAGTSKTEKLKDIL